MNRRIVLLISGLLMFNIVFSQLKTNEYFLRKSKNQRTTAWILLSTGVASIVTGAIIDNSNRGEKQSYTGGYIEVGGIICTLTSIPFFISSSKNKKRANRLSINTRYNFLPHRQSFISNVQPYVSELQKNVSQN